MGMHDELLLITHMGILFYKHIIFYNDMVTYGSLVVVSEKLCKEFIDQARAGSHLLNI